MHQHSVQTIVKTYVHWSSLIDTFSVPSCVPVSVNEPSKWLPIIIEYAGWQIDDGRVMAGNGGLFDTGEALYQSYSKFLSCFSNPVSKFSLTYLRGFGGIQLIFSVGVKSFFLTAWDAVTCAELADLASEATLLYSTVGAATTRFFLTSLCIPKSRHEQF